MITEPAGAFAAIGAHMLMKDKNVINNDIFIAGLDGTLTPVIFFPICN